MPSSFPQQHHLDVAFPFLSYTRIRAWIGHASRLAFALSLLFVAVPSIAQTDPMSADARPFAPLQGGDIDSVSSANGSLQVRIPLYSIKQRGNLSLAFSLRYASSGYTKLHQCLAPIPGRPSSCTDSYTFYGRGVVVSATTDVTVTAIPAVAEDTSDPSNPTFFDQGYYWQVTTPDGGTHKLAAIGNHNFRAEDGSGWLFNETTYTLTSQDGVHYVFAGTPAPGNGVAYPFVSRLLYVEDTNGNQINLTYTSYVSDGVTFYQQTGWIDSLGRAIPLEFGTSTTDFSGCTGNGTIVAATVWTPPGASASIKYCSAMTQLNTDFFQGAPLSQPGPFQTEFEDQRSVQFLQSVVLLDGSAWTFQYTPLSGSQYNYGELSQVTLPTGGTIGYNWAEGYQMCTDTASQSHYNSIVTSRILNANDGLGPQPWTYGSPYAGVAPPTSPVTSTTTDPLGNKTVHTLTSMSGTCSLFETQTDFYDNNGNKLRTDSTSYLSQPDMNRLNTNYEHEAQMAMAVFPYVKSTTLWINATTGDTKSITFAYDTGFSATSLDGLTNAVIPYGQVVNKIETDYGSGSPGATLRTTATTYWSSQNSAALANNLLEQPALATVTDGPTGTQQTTTYGYDGGAFSAGNASSSGWNANPLSGATRGNQTSVTQNWDTNGVNLTTSKTYTNTGMLASITEPPNSSITPAASTSYQYSGSYDGAYLTTKTDALGHPTQYGYDEGTGLVTVVTDPNGVQTAYGYDSAERLYTVSRAAGSHNLASNISYTYPDANTVVRAEALNSSTQPETLTTKYDGMGREVKTDHVDPESDVYVDITYDALGRKSSVSTPYRSQSDLTAYGLAIYSYDALDRTIQVKNPDQSTATTQYTGATTLTTSESNGTAQPQKLTRLDGLGRMVKVCEISGTTPPVGGDVPGSCGMEISGTGFVSSYTQTTRGLTAISQGAQSRSFAYDSLGRLTDSTNPETGHLHYVYDADGNVVSKTSPLPNGASGSSVTMTANYQYDALHRLTQKTYTRSDGGAITTPTANYSYDQSSVDGKTLENSLGHLTSDYTTLNGAIQAKSIYSYDNAGSTESHYQCVLTACTGGYQDVEYDYDGAEDLTLQTTPQNAFTYTYNQAAHLTGVTPGWIADSTHPATLLSSAQYAPNGGWSVAHFGNLTNESYVYTPRWLQTLQVNGYNPNSLPHGVVAIRIDGTEQSTQVISQPATAGSASVTVTGSEKSVTSYIPVGCKQGAIAAQTANPEIIPPCTTVHTYDQGTLTITINGHADSKMWDSSTLTSSSLAAALVSTINSDSSAAVTASASGSVITLRAKATGAASNYSTSISVSHTATSTFPTASYGFSGAPATLSGGANAGMTTVYDKGTMTLIVNGATQSVPYGQGSTWQSVGQALIGAANANASFPATLAYIDGQTMSVTARLGGSIGNYSMVFTTTYDSAHFLSGSFIPVRSANALSGGQDQTGTETAIYSFSLGHALDGQITSASDSVNGNWSYTYDDFNRLHTATETDSNSNVLSSLSWDYDRYGNRWHQNNTGGIGLTHQLTFNIANNQTTTNLVYDVAGNILNDTNNLFTYDAENRIAQVGGSVSYIYDAEGRRVGKSGGTVYVVGLDGRVIDELNGAAWKRTEIYAGGRHLATETPSTGVIFTHADWIGTERVRTNPLGEPCLYTTSEPFGDDAQSSTPSGGTGCNPSPNFLTGKPRDAESGLDDFGARYFSSQWGRWMSPDWSKSPAAVPYASLGNPQSLNLYGYVGNDPISGQDPDGHSTYIWDDVTGGDNGDGMRKKEDAENRNRDQTKPGSGDQSQEQQQTGDPTLPTTVQEPSPSLMENALMPSLETTLIVGTDGLGELAEAGAALSRVLELSSAMGKTADYVTLAITETKEGTTVVSSSEKTLRPAVKALLKDGEVAAKGAGHAEVTGVNAAKQMGLTPTAVAASRGICPSCADFLRTAGVAALSALKGIGIF